MKQFEGWTIGFDADDTLWHNERFFQLTQARFADLLRDHADADHLSDRLLAAERRNLGHYGYGIKGFVLSMIETAIEVTEERVPASVISELIAAGQEMLAHPIELLPGVEETIVSLKGSAGLILVTKGDLLDQERKLAQSGLGDHFDRVEIVSEKTAPTYARIFQGRDRAVMVGNSLRSDIIPAIEAGAHGIHIPHDLTWEMEKADAPSGHPRFHRIETMTALPELLDKIA
ncbi:HAD family hydrolase [Ponticoccus sp. SC2-23]|uniref:HAD family hydrolase n=1 Tax=Alexandriicola marinus TaxID=2081710 RepID=UPI000FDCCD3F|nr:HAD family hydrolase [Alexandriicola marinus]MBM1220250.1 HAD family hydrolase [Ponticoccus sp. SC6-9]MBM1224936.1 HAD family hydrolase [Ponticoccus sp. SC6-15]MBM1228450.1 HAD family hydrolase [Ponticoccus sp. SC6-38]MBM1233913.1 HAD family hydrolase [Ponticoccus sp. SC6-45]MBM1238951.1 HAD family hydrolase [Ponticoccus sp. SC6-49]MBM1242733.1 HAD family hydrolase [Ponticoccus sp. SC2-64]MBM1247437.1 HAD family hydrolase [Ponticoccus sp. SC6-42]MBM1251904.1 HAD family hydrolase [Pontico